MLSGARMAGAVSFHAACRFFSRAVWDVDRPGLVAARFIVERLLDDDAPITVVVDDTLFKRWGRKVHHALWTHDGAAQGGKKIARGNRWVVAGIVVGLPWCTAPVCLPVLFRSWAGKGTASPVELAAELLGLIAAEFPGHQVHGVGDAAYHGNPLLVPHTTWTTRLPANAALYDLAPPRTGRRGRPALKGGKLGKPAAVAQDVANWEKATVVGYGRTESVLLAEVPCIWYGSFGNTVDRCVLVREEGSSNTYELALFTVDANATATGVVQRYAVRWSIEPSKATSKQQTGVGQARNRGAQGGRADRALRHAGADLGHRLVHPARLPPRRRTHPAAFPTVVRQQDRAILPRHDRQATQNLDRSQIYRGSPTSRRSRSIARLLPGLRGSRRVSAKHKVMVSGGYPPGR
jgi:hypothetical protein